MNKYNLAIIIPCYNSSRYLEDMLNSILLNTYQDWKVIAIDDHSTDNTISILDKYQKKDKRISFYLRNRFPKGAQTCRNIGFELSEGAKYVIWMDADDIIAPYCLEQRVNYMDKHRELDFAIFPAKRFINDPLEDNPDIWGYDYMGDTLRCFLNRTLMVVGWTNIYKRNAVTSRNLKWDERILSLQDADWNIQAIVSGMKYQYASKEGANIDYFYRTVHNGIASNIKTSHSHFMSHVYHINKTLDSLTNKQLEQYEDDIRGCLLEFACIMMKDKIAFDALTRIVWFQERRLFLLRLYLLRFFRGRGKFKIFRKEAYYHCNIRKKWWEYKRKNYDEIKKVK